MRPVNRSDHFVSAYNNHIPSLNANQNLINQWEAWAERAQEGMGEQRDIALSLLIKYLEYNADVLALNNLNLTELPPNWPNGIKVLDVSDNQLTSLTEKLPQGLCVLRVDNNRLTQLPENLPDNLYLLNADYNQLTQLPENLPTGLQELFVFNNRLTQLPESLPNGLCRLNAGNNQLTRLPENLPATLQEFRVYDNLLIRSPENFPTEPRMLSIKYNSLYDLPNFIEALDLWNKKIDIQPWKRIAQENNANVFFNFLRQLHDRRNVNNTALKQTVSEWLNYLAKDDNVELRKQTFAMVKEGLGYCIDRTSYYFNQIYLLMIEYRLIKDSASISVTFNTVRSLFRMQELEKIAASDVKQRQKSDSRFREDIEIYFAYQYCLRKKLALPIYTTLEYGHVARLTKNNLENAKNQVLRKEEQYFLHYLVNESDAWNQKIENWNGGKVAMAKTQFLEKVEDMTSKPGTAYEINSKCETDRLKYEIYFPLTREFLKENNALSLLDLNNHSYKITEQRNPKKCCDRCVIG